MPCISTTLPAAAARIGVPDGTPMSMPGWQDSHARDSQNGDVIGPLTGQISPPDPGLTGPARDRARSSRRAWPGSSPAASAAPRRRPRASWRRSRELASRRFLSARAVWMRSRRSTRPTRTLETSSRWSSICVATFAWRFSSVSSCFAVVVASALASATMRHDLRVLVRDALHEVRAGQQVGEAVGLEHDRDRVGRVGLVELDQAVGERAADDQQPGAQAGQPRALLAQLALDDGELGALGVEAGLQLLLAGRQPRDVALQGVDPSTSGCEMSVVSTRSLALWPPISDWLRSIFFWIVPGSCAEEPTGRTDQSTKGRLATRTSSVRRSRMRPSMLGNRLLTATARFPAWCRSFTRR